MQLNMPAPLQVERLVSGLCCANERGSILFKMGNNPNSYCRNVRAALTQ